jgi:hypothetical protein
MKMDGARLRQRDEASAQCDPIRSCSSRASIAVLRNLSDFSTIKNDLVLISPRDLPGAFGEYHVPAASPKKLAASPCPSISRSARSHHGHLAVGCFPQLFSLSSSARLHQPNSPVSKAAPISPHSFHSLETAYLMLKEQYCCILEPHVLIG